MVKLFPSFLLMFLSLFCYSHKNDLSGVVINAKTNKKLPNVNVFLDHTTIGMTTDKKGRYHLKNLPKGTYYLVFATDGFKRIRKKINIPQSYDSPINVSLSPDDMTKNNYIVQSKYPKKWHKDFNKFKKRFLGYTRNAEKTTILNPEILKFNIQNGVLLAYADEPLELKNEALGYQITLYLKQFDIDDSYLRTDATSRFTELEPKNKKQLEYWKKERKRAYNGSFRHFLNALAKGETTDEGFRLLFTNERKTYYHSNAIPHTHRETKVFHPEKFWNYNSKGQMKLTFKKGYKFLKVVYRNEHPEQSIGIMLRIKPELNLGQVSFIKLPKDSALIDLNTSFGIPPYLPITYGYWAWSSCIPEWLPKEYHP